MIAPDGARSAGRDGRRATGRRCGRAARGPSPRCALSAARPARRARRQGRRRRGHRRVRRDAKPAHRDRPLPRRAPRRVARGQASAAAVDLHGALHAENQAEPRFFHAVLGHCAPRTCHRCRTFVGPACQRVHHPSSVCSNSKPPRCHFASPSETAACSALSRKSSRSSRLVSGARLTAAISLAATRRTTSIATARSSSSLLTSPRATALVQPTLRPAPAAARCSARSPQGCRSLRLC